MGVGGRFSDFFVVLVGCVFFLGLGLVFLLRRGVCFYSIIVSWRAGRFSSGWSIGFYLRII